MEVFPSLCDTSYQWYNDLTIGVSLEMICLLQCPAHNSVVVDFAIDRKGNAVILVGNRLSTTVDTDDAQTLVCQNWRC
jgi:hypothetical protein